jgi:hypothetical protein
MEFLPRLFPDPVPFRDPRLYIRVLRARREPNAWVQVEVYLPVHLADTTQMEEFLTLANELKDGVIEMERASGNWDTVWGQVYVYEF